MLLEFLSFADLNGIFSYAFSLFTFLSDLAIMPSSHRRWKGISAETRRASM